MPRRTLRCFSNSRSSSGFARASWRCRTRRARRSRNPPNRNLRARGRGTPARSRQLLSMHVAALSFACSAACGHADTENIQNPMKAAAGATSSSVQAGASGGSPHASIDDVGTSATSPQGTCPDGFGCARVVYPTGSRLCLKRGESFAPSCDVTGKCPDLPMAECTDPGLGTKVCSEFCEVPST